MLFSLLKGNLCNFVNKTKTSDYQKSLTAVSGVPIGERTQIGVCVCVIAMCVIANV